MGEEGCLKPQLGELKLEPDTERDVGSQLEAHSAARKSDKVSRRHTL